MIGHPCLHLIRRTTQRIVHRAARAAVGLLVGLSLTVPLLHSPALYAQAPASPTHTIEPGETLSEIAQQYGVPLDELMALNSISDPDAIYWGQILVLPVDDDTTGATPPEVSIDPAAPTEDKTALPATHVVQPGETLTAIAQRYSVPFDELMAINGIDDADTIVIGQTLRLTPVTTTDTAQAAPTPTPTEPSGSGNPIASRNQTYSVEPGDSVATIALHFGVDEASLRRINGLGSSTLLELNQVLIIPATRSDLALPPSQGVNTTASDSEREADYVVQPGDSLSLIAQDNGYSLAELMEANQIAGPDTIYVGQALRFPPKDGAESDASTGDGDTEEPGDSIASRFPLGPPRRGYFYYTVKPGDTLSALARDFDTTQLALLEYNDLPNAETVYRGLELRIPYGPPQLPITSAPTPLSGTSFVVSLSRQQCWVLQGSHVRYTWTCSTGYGKWITRTGSFAVQTKMELAKSTAYELDMPFWLGIYDVGAYENGIHGLPVKWETGEKIWEGLIGQPATFGCAMLDDDDAATLFDLAFIGMPVHIVQ